MAMQADKKEFWFAVLVTLIGLGAVLPAQEPVKVETPAAQVAVTAPARCSDKTAAASTSVAPVTPAAPVTTAASASPVTPIAPAVPVRKIVVSLPDRKLALLEDGKVKAIYTVAVGKGSTPSPMGTFTIVSHVANPSYTHNGKVVAPGPANPVGTRWMGLSEKGYGIHGTNVPSSIGKATSHGCVRLGKKDLEQLFTMVQVGDSVEIIGDRNDEMVSIFGEQLKPTVPGVMMAQVSATQTAGMHLMQGQE